MSKLIRILIADDDELVRAAIGALLADEPDIEVVGEAASGDEVIACTTALLPDVLLLDLLMPGKTGIQVIAELKQRTPTVRILVLTGFADTEMGLVAIQTGAAGYLRKSVDITELHQAIQAVSQGEMPLQPSVAGELIRRLTHPTPPPTTRELLTKSEIAILRLVARGLSNQDIGLALSLHETTVRTHMTHILRKLNMSSRTQAALYALKTGLAELSSYT